MGKTELLSFIFGCLTIAGMAVWWVHEAGQMSCVRSGIQAGWATEAIKELCK